MDKLDDSVNLSKIETYRVRNIGYYSSFIIKKFHLKKISRWFRLLPFVEPIYQLLYFRNPTANNSEDFVLLRRQDILTDYPDGVQEPRKYIALHRKFFNINGPFITFAYMPAGYEQPYHRHKHIPDFTLFLAPTAVKFISHGVEHFIEGKEGDMFYVPVKLQHTLQNISVVASANITVRPALDHRVMLTQDDWRLIRAYGDNPKIFKKNVQHFDWGDSNTYEVRTVGNFTYRAELIHLKSCRAVTLKPPKEKDSHWEEVLILLNASTVRASDGHKTFTVKEGDVLYAPWSRAYKVSSMDDSALLYRTFVMKNLSGGFFSKFFEKDQSGCKLFWSISVDARVRELSLAARDYLQKTSNESATGKVWSYPRLETLLRDRQVAVENFHSERVDYFYIPEMADFADLELDKTARSFYSESESLFRRILEARDTREQKILAHKLQTKDPRRVAVPVLKYLANTAELEKLGNIRFNEEMHAAKSFLRNFTTWYFNELGGREILSAYAVWVEQKVKEIIELGATAENNIQIVAILRGGKALGCTLRARGFAVQDLLFTKAMAESFGLKRDGTVNRLTARGKKVLEQYLNFQHILTARFKYIVFLDVGSKGSLFPLLKEVLVNKGISSKLLLLYHSDDVEHMDGIEGLNEDLNWNGLDNETLRWHAFMLNDGLEQLYEVPANVDWSDINLTNPPTRSTPRKWYAHVSDQAIRQFTKTIQCGEAMEL